MPGDSELLRLQRQDEERRAAQLGGAQNAPAPAHKRLAPAQLARCRSVPAILADLDPECREAPNAAANTAKARDAAQKQEAEKTEVAVCLTTRLAQEKKERKERQRAAQRKREERLAKQLAELEKDFTERTGKTLGE